MRKEGYSMIFDGHSDIFSDVRYKREAGETQVLKNHHLDRLRKGGCGNSLRCDKVTETDSLIFFEKST